MISMNKRIFLVFVASFFSNPAAIDGTSYSKLDHGAQVNGGVRRMIRENEETPKASGEERAGREVPDLIEFLPIRSNVEEPVVRNVPNEVNVQNDAAMSRLSENLGVDIGQVQEKVNLLLRARRGSDDGGKVIMFYMALGSEFFEQLVKRDPSVITFPWPYGNKKLADVFQPLLVPHISRIISYVEKHGIRPDDVLGKILWLQNQEVVIHDRVAPVYMAFGSELLKNKPASTSRERWGETLSLVTPGTTHLEE